MGENDPKQVMLSEFVTYHYWLGYEANLGTIGQSATTSHNMCWLVAGLYMFSAILQFIGLAVIYNLDKKTLNQMTTELAQRHNAE